MMQSIVSFSQSLGNLEVDMFFHFLFFELHFWGLKPYLDIEFEDLKNHFQNNQKPKNKERKKKWRKSETQKRWKHSLEPSQQ